ncbi:MAG: alpha/beta hydrolase [bacterium]
MSTLKKTTACIFAVIAVFILSGAAANAASLKPTNENVSYAAHERAVFDFWKAKSDKPTPLVIYIHGGGFQHGDKGLADDAEIQKFLANGVSYASISYPYYEDVALQGIIRDYIARVVQFFRYNSAEYNIDKARIATYGESAGAASSLWLAVHDDIVDPGSEDPIRRESTRITAAGAVRTQATYDFTKWAQLLAPEVPAKTMKAWQMIMMRTVLDMYHLKNEKQLYSKDSEPVRNDLDMISMIDKNDSPVFMETLEGKYKDGDLLHHAKHAKAVKEKCDSAGLECVLVVDATPADQRISVVDYLIGKLKK